MKALCMGFAYGIGGEPILDFRSRRGHETRYLAVEGAAKGTHEREADYYFTHRETAAEVVSRIGREWMPDVFICWVPELRPPPREIENCPVKSVAIPSDWNLAFPVLEYNLARYDVVLTDKLGARTLSLRGAAAQYHSPLYSHRTRFHKNLGLERDIDVLFVGNLNHAIHAQRGRVLERVAALSDRYRVKVCGGYYDEDYNRLLNRARIILNHSVRGEMNLRCFEALACGALLFLEEDNLEVRELLEDREEVVLYTSGNLPELLARYLDDPEELDRVARNGASKAAALAAESRLDDLLDWLAIQPMGERAFRGFPPPKRAEATVLQYAGSVDGREASYAAVSEAIELFPDHPEFHTLAGAFALEDASHAPEEEVRSLIRRGLGVRRHACALAPDVIVFWLNLATACGANGKTEVEVECLGQALKAQRADYGGLLAGTPLDPYFAAWQRELANGSARCEFLWAMAARRLADLCLERKDFAAAADAARNAIAWLPDLGAPYHALAKALLELGDMPAAAETLERGLPFTVFDAHFRLMLVHLWCDLGRTDDACELADESRRIFAAVEGHESTAETFRVAGEECLARER